MSPEENITNPEVPQQAESQEEFGAATVPVVPTVPTEGKPVGPATIVNMDTPADVFLTQGDDTTNQQ